MTKQSAIRYTDILADAFFECISRDCEAIKDDTLSDEMIGRAYRLGQEAALEFMVDNAR